MASLKEICSRIELQKEVQEIILTMEENREFFQKDEDIRELTVPGKVTARTIAPGVFREVWDQAAERPDGFMGMFF